MDQGQGACAELTPSALVSVLMLWEIVRLFRGTPQAFSPFSELTACILQGRSKSLLCSRQLYLLLGKVQGVRSKNIAVSRLLLNECMATGAIPWGEPFFTPQFRSNHLICQATRGLLWSSWESRSSFWCLRKQQWWDPSGQACNWDLRAGMRTQISGGSLSLETPSALISSLEQNCSS